jgi:hypothetical protein
MAEHAERGQRGEQGLQGERGEHGEGMTRAARRAVITLFVINFLVAGACLWFTTYQVSHSSRQWCDTLGLLTSQPVPRPADPAANPSRMQAYTLYADFVTLRNDFGCQRTKGNGAP